MSCFCCCLRFQKLMSRLCSAVFQAGGLVVALVEVARKSYLASIVPVIVDAVLNEHQVVLDIVAFVPLGDFPRSRLGEKQRGKILASWVTRKMRTMAQFSIHDPDGSEPQSSDVPDGRSVTPNRAGTIGGGSTRKPTPQIESDSQDMRLLPPSQELGRMSPGADPYPRVSEADENAGHYQGLHNEPDPGVSNAAIPFSAGTYLDDDATPVEGVSRLAITNPEAPVFELGSNSPTSAYQTDNLGQRPDIQIEYHELDENPSTPYGRSSTPPFGVGYLPDSSGRPQPPVPPPLRGRDSLPSQQLRYSGMASGNTWDSRRISTPPVYQKANQPQGQGYDSAG